LGLIRHTHITIELAITIIHRCNNDRPDGRSKQLNQLQVDRLSTGSRSHLL
jgi:hypothetical protein